MKIKIDIKELLEILKADEIELTARNETMDTSGDYREVEIYCSKNLVDIKIKQRET